MKRWYYATQDGYCYSATKKEAKAMADAAWEKAASNPDAFIDDFEVEWGECVRVEKLVHSGSQEDSAKSLPSDSEKTYYSLSRTFGFDWHLSAEEARERSLMAARIASDPTCIEDVLHQGGDVLALRFVVARLDEERGKMPKLPVLLVEWGEITPREKVTREPTVLEDGSESFDFVYGAVDAEPDVPLGDLEREIIAYAEGYAAGRVSLNEPIAKWHEGQKDPS